jgi:hypothetical protein
MSSNSALKGGRASYASKDKQTAAYDAPPHSSREALANATFSWAPYQIKQQFERRELTAKACVNLIAIWDRKQIARDRYRVWGLDATSKPKRT